ncbi:hypothetical protein NECAME_18165, partial [Necator americanus]
MANKRMEKAEHHYLTPMKSKFPMTLRAVLVTILRNLISIHHQKQTCRRFRLITCFECSENKRVLTT